MRGKFLELRGEYQVIVDNKSANDTKWWVIMSLRNYIDLNKRMISKASIDNYEKRCDEKF